MVRKIIFYSVIIIVVVSAIIFLLPTQVINNASLSGIQIRSQLWNGTILIKGSVYFRLWATLTISPGTKVIFEKSKDIEGTDWTKYADEFIKKHNDPTGKKGYEQSHYSLFGKIIAQGTKEKPILFTSAQLQPEYADWDQLILLEGSKLDYVELSYAHNGVNIDGKNVTITNSKIHDSLWSCIDIFSTGNTIEKNEVYHCWHQGIGLKKVGQNRIVNNYIHDAQLSINCENGAQPEILNNTIKAAPINPDCGNGIGTKELPGEPDTKGGTYNGILIYPSKEEVGVNY